jgi:hypothetical protein
MQLWFAFIVSEDCTNTATFVDTFQERNHWLRRHCVAVFGSYDNFAFVLGPTEEEAKGTFDLFLGCKFFYDFVKQFVVVKS